MKKKIKIFLIFVMVLYGCIIIPTPGDKEISGEKISGEKLVFIEHGITSKSEIIEQLGQPDFYLIDVNIFAYDWQTRAGFLLWFVPHGYSGTGGVVELPKNKMLLIEFDADDFVKNHESTTRIWFETYGYHWMEWIKKNEISE